MDGMNGNNKLGWVIRHPTREQGKTYWTGSSWSVDHKRAKVFKSRGDASLEWYNQLATEFGRCEIE